MRISFRRTCWFILCVLLWGSAHFAFADAYLHVEQIYARPESVSGLVQVPGVEKPMRYYAQNDDLWKQLTYERKDVKSMRPFRDSGCSPSALAMAIAKLVPEEQLAQVGQYAKTPYSLCSCSISKNICAKHSARYLITSQRDYVRFLPLVFADFACGNNTFGVFSRSAAAGTGTGYIDKICDIYQLEYRFTPDYEEALQAVNRENQAVMVLASSGGCFTNTGHYVFLAHADEEKLYVLDPLSRTEYKTKRSGSLEILQPGLVALRHEKAGHARFSNFIIITKTEN